LSDIGPLQEVVIAMLRQLEPVGKAKRAKQADGERTDWRNEQVSTFDKADALTTDGETLKQLTGPVTNCTLLPTVECIFRNI
jgi:hypothetical protein